MASRTYITSCNVLYTHIHYFELCADIYFTFARVIYILVYFMAPQHCTLPSSHASNFAVYRTEPYGFVFTAIFVHHALLEHGFICVPTNTHESNYTPKQLVHSYCIAKEQPSAKNGKTYLQQSQYLVRQRTKNVNDVKTRNRNATCQNPS